MDPNYEKSLDSLVDKFDSQMNIKLNKANVNWQEQFENFCISRKPIPEVQKSQEIEVSTTYWNNDEPAKDAQPGV